MEVHEQSDNIITRLFKAKYYPHDDFMESRVGRNPSYMSHSTWSFKHVVRGGYKWSIVTNNNIPLWDHSWLGDKSFISNQSDHDLELKNLTMVDSMFNQTRI